MNKFWEKTSVEEIEEFCKKYNLSIIFNFYGPGLHVFKKN